MCIVNFPFWLRSGDKSARKLKVTGERREWYDVDFQHYSEQKQNFIGGDKYLYDLDI